MKTRSLIEILSAALFVGWSTHALAAGGLKEALLQDIATWSEDVQLHDGTVVKVERTVRSNKFGFPQSSRGSAVEWTVSAPKLGVTWTGKFPEDRKPLAFDVFDGKPYLLAEEGGRFECSHGGYYGIPAALWRWEGGRWEAVAAEKGTVNRMTINLLQDFRGVTAKKDASGHFSLPEKARKDQGWNAGLPAWDYFVVTRSTCADLARLRAGNSGVK